LFTYYFTRLFSITYDSGIKPAVVSIVVKLITPGGVMKITGILKTLMIGLVLVGSLSFSADVRASIIPALEAGSPTGPVAGVFTFTYDVGISADQKVNTGAVPGASVNTGVGVLGSTYASFFTIYDFAGFNGTHVDPAGWTFESVAGNLGATPNTTVPIDSAAVANLTWYFTGAVPPASGTTVTGFSAGSTFIGTPVLHNYTSGATKNTPLDPSTNNTAIGSIGTVVAPGPANPPAIPEPTTLLLLGSGLAGLAGWRQWRTKRA